MGTAVAPQLQARRGLHHAGGHTGHIALGDLAALGIQHAVPDDQGAVAGNHGAGTDDAVGGDLHVVHLALGSVVDHDRRAVACKIVNAVAGQVKLRILDGIDGIAADVQAVEADLLGLVGGILHLGIGDLAGNLRIGGLGQIEPAVQHVHGFHSGERRRLGRAAAGESGAGLSGLNIRTGHGAGMLGGTAGGRAGLDFRRCAGHGRHIAHGRHHIDFFRLVYGALQSGHAVGRDFCLNRVHQIASLEI